MSWDPNQRSAAVSSSADIDCAICLEKIVPEAKCDEEKPRTLDCSHIFHRECIGSWLVQKHNCPLCRTAVKVDAPEARPPEMSLEEILAVPDHQQQAPVEQNNEGIILIIRRNVLEARRVRRLDLNENTPIAQTARKVNALALRFFNQ